MKQCKLLIRVTPLALTFLLPSLCLAQVDSLVDCFPLSTGNQWVYHYDRWIVPAEFAVLRDTGTIAYSIIGKVDFPDSVLWNFKEERNIHRIYFFTGLLQSDSVITDSTLFNLLELKSGRHELYRRTNDSTLGNFNTSILWNSVLPFLSSFPDTSKLFRYYQLDTAETIFITLTFPQGAMEYGVTLKKNIGLQSLVVNSTDTWQDGPPHGYHELLTQTITTVNEHLPVTVPTTIRLEQNYPNPFNPTTQIEYDLPARIRVNLAIYNVLGHEIARLVEWQFQSGHHVTWFDATNLSSGVYFVILSTDQSILVRKMVLVR